MTHGLDSFEPAPDGPTAWLAARQAEVDRERWEYPTDEQAEAMRADAKAQYDAWCAEQGIKPDHDDDCDDDNPCGECRADAHADWIEESLR